MKRFLTRSLIAVAMALLGWITITSVRDIRVNNAKRYCEALIPKLEAYREAHGIYPAEISVIADLKRAPSLLKREHGFYKQTRGGESYNMWFDKLDGFSGAFYRHADDRSWRHAE